MPRGPPPPRDGLPGPTSAVVVIGRKPQLRPIKTTAVPPQKPGVPSEMFLAPASARPFGRNGLEKLGWLRMLNTSARNCMVTRSPSLVSLNTEKSSCLRDGPRKESRPMFPKCRVPDWQFAADGAVLPGAKVQGIAKEVR